MFGLIGLVGYYTITNNIKNIQEWNCMKTKLNDLVNKYAGKGENMLNKEEAELDSFIYKYYVQWG